MSYVIEKFEGAIDSLRGSGSIHERITKAILYNLAMLKPEKVPDEIREEFKELVDRMESGEPIAEEGTVAAYCYGLSREDAFKVQDQILAMYEVVKESAKG